MLDRNGSRSDGKDVATDLHRLVEAFDLGEYEIEAYLTVIAHGDLTASELADNADVPQPRVYDTVRSLADRGLVELRESRPMRVIAIRPEEAFRDLQDSLSEVVSALETTYTEPASNTEAATLVKSRSAILRYIETVIETAEYELSLSLTPELLARFEEELATAADRGVSTDLIVTPMSEAPDPDVFDYASIARAARTRRGITTPVIAVADGSYSVYATQTAIRDGTDEYGVIFNRSALGFLVLGFFGTVLWTTADQTLFEDGHERGFPRRYASIRRCVKDIRETSRPVYATIEGRDVETGERRVVRGEIVSTRFTEDEEVATLVLETDSKRIDIGGRVAAYEDIEAHEIRVDRETPPPEE